MLYIHVRGEITEGRAGKRYGRLSVWLTGRPPDDLELAVLEARDIHPVRLFAARVRVFLFRASVEPWLSGRVEMLRPAHEWTAPLPGDRQLRAAEFGVDQPDQA